MPRFEYRIVPAPEKASKIKGLKGPARFAATLEEIMNEMGRDGWHYLRADTLPQEERSGLTSKTITYRNVLVFQRPMDDPAPEPVAPPPEAEPTAPVEATPAEDADLAPTDALDADGQRKSVDL